MKRNGWRVVLLPTLSCLIFVGTMCFAATPTISSLSPTSGPVNTYVAINGSGFGTQQHSSTVTFNGVTAAVTSWASGTIGAIVPTAATSGYVVVTVSGVSSAQNANSYFTVLPTPIISSLSPTSGPVGTTVTITGTNFGATQGSGSVRFSLGVTATTISWSDTSIVVIVPQSALTGNVVVESSSGVDSNAYPFTVIYPPSISSLSPTSGVDGTPVTITGQTFGSTQGTSTVTFNGTPATPTSWSDTSIIVPVPSGATSGNVRVTVGGQTSWPNTSSIFAVGPVSSTVFHLHSGAGSRPGSNLMSTAAVSPPNTLLQSSDLKGNTAGNAGVAFFSTLAGILGTIPNNSTINFDVWMNETTSVSGIYPVFRLYTWNNGNLNNVCSASPTTALTTTLARYQISCTSNALPTTSIQPFLLYVDVRFGTIQKSVKAQVYFEGTPNGQYDSQISVPEVVPPVPSIASLSPAMGSVGTVVTIAGANFGASQGSSSVTFNGTAATVATWTSTSIVVTVPSGATTGNVVVTVLGQPSGGQSFTVLPPNISALSPSIGPVGTLVTINGTYFGATKGSSTVTFNGTVGTPASWSDSQIVVPVPAGTSTGNVNVVITVSGNPSNGAVFNVLPTPTISSLSPLTGPSGTSVTITGTNFGSTQGSSTVTFNGTAATPTNWSATSITVPVPATATTGPVTVTVFGVVSNNPTFTVTNPKITGLSPSVGALGTSVTISGINLGTTQGSSSVTFNGVAATPTTWGRQTTVIAPVPAGATTGPVIVTVAGVASNSLVFTIGPGVTSLYPVSGAPGTSVTITGSGFGATQGSSAVTFNGVPATPFSWSDTSIVVPVPPTASTGPVMILMGSAASNSVTFTVPPSISNVSPSSGVAGAVVTVTGANFGSSQGTGMLTFGGNLAIPISWGPNKIVAPVPSGAATGPIVVTVAGQASNGVTFTVGTGAIAGVVSRTADGNPVSSALIEALQANISVASALSAANGTYSIPSLAPGVYDLRVTAGGYGTTILPSNNVTTTTTTVNVSLGSAGTIAGRVVQSDGITPISGASVTALEAGDTAGTATSDATGAYTISNLSAASYTLQAAAAGYTTQNQSVSVTAGNTVTTNFSLSEQSVITYEYDEVGRLIGVVDSQQGAAGYSYDAVGNILAISRANSGQVAILGFTPESGPIGTTITIAGTGFTGATAVAFNGTNATTFTVISDSQLTAVVPTGATTGTISVTTPGGSANSIMPFTVTASTSAPTITSFTPAMANVGAPVTIAGTNFDVPLNDRVKLNIGPAGVSSATSTSISTSVPAAAGSGHITVATPMGTSVSTNDFFILPAGYTPAGVDFTTRMAIGGTYSGTINTGGHIGMVLFDGTAGHKVSISISGVTLASSSVSLIGPNGAYLTQLGVGTGGGFIDDVVMPTAGTYSLLVVSTGSSTGSMTLQTFDSSDKTGTIAFNTPTVISNSIPGQVTSLKFSGTAGQSISLLFGNGTGNSPPNTYPTNGNWLGIKDPNGNILYNANLQLKSRAGYGSGCCSGWNALPTQVNQYGDILSAEYKLPSTGTYTVFLDPLASTGQVTMELYTFVDTTGTIAFNTPTTMSNTYPGQTTALSFSGTAGQTVSVQFDNGMPPDSSYPDTYPTSGVRLGIKDASGNSLAEGRAGNWGGCCSGWNYAVTSFALPSMGTYSVFIDPMTNTGSVTVKLTSP